MPFVVKNGSMLLAFKDAFIHPPHPAPHDFHLR